MARPTEAARLGVLWRTTLLWMAIGLVQVLRLVLWPVATPRMWLALRGWLGRVMRWADAAG